MPQNFLNHTTIVALLCTGDIRIHPIFVPGDMIMEQTFNSDLKGPGGIKGIQLDARERQNHCFYAYRRLYCTTM